MSVRSKKVGPVGDGAEGPAEGVEVGDSPEGQGEVSVYCDGACRGNPGPGGWGAILRQGRREKVLSGAVAQTTNNRMELTAAIAAFHALARPSRVKVVTDSKYVVVGITEWIHDWLKRGWKTSAKKRVLNRDLWEELHGLCQKHTVTWEWVRGHAGHEMNERCDQLANEAIDRFLVSAEEHEP